MSQPPPHAVETLLSLARSMRSKLEVTVDQRGEGDRFVTIKRLFFAKDGAWRVVRSVSLQLSDIEAVCAALRAAVQSEGKTP